jgi:hypothetical protein
MLAISSELSIAGHVEKGKLAWVDRNGATQRRPGAPGSGIIQAFIIR